MSFANWPKSSRVADDREHWRGGCAPWPEAQDAAEPAPLGPEAMSATGGPAAQAAGEPHSFRAADDGFPQPVDDTADRPATPLTSLAPAPSPVAGVSGTYAGQRAPLDDQPEPHAGHGLPMAEPAAFAPDAPPAPEAGGGLGWTDLAWAEAGGFEAVLAGHGGGVLPPAVTPATAEVTIEHAVFNMVTLVQNTLIQNTQIIFNAGEGASFDIDGDISAVSAQQVMTASAGRFEEEDFEAAFRDFLADGLAPGGVAGGGGLAISHLEFNAVSLTQNVLIQQTEIIFNVGAGATFDIDGNVSAVSSQTALALDGHLPPHALT